MNLVQAVNPKSHRFYTRANVQKVHLPEDMPSDIQGLSRKELKEKEKSL